MGIMLKAREEKQTQISDEKAITLTDEIRYC